MERVGALERRAELSLSPERCVEFGDALSVDVATEIRDERERRSFALKFGGVGAADA